MGHSAYLNTPPANDLDRKIAKGMYLYFGTIPNDTMLAEGVIIPPFRPDNYQFESKGPGIIAGLSVCIAIIVIVTLTRLYLRIFVQSLKFGTDDYIIIPAFLLAVAYPALQIAMVTYGGAGKHMFDITYQEYDIYKWVRTDSSSSSLSEIRLTTSSTQLADISQTFFYVAVGLIKCSIACFNIRLTSIASTTWKYVNYIFLVLCSMYTLAALFLNVFRCSPPGFKFDLVRLAAHGQPLQCLSINDMNSILRINLALDFSLLAIPIIVLWKVQMSWRKKSRLFALLSVGAIACIASVMTLVSQYTLATDPLWNYTTLLTWIMVELTVSILAACAPTLACIFPSSMRTQAQGSVPSHRGTPFKGSSAYGLGSQVGKRDTTLRSRPLNGPEDEEDERRIIVTEEVEMKWHGSNVSDGSHLDGRSVTTWLDDGKPLAHTEVFDGRPPEAMSRPRWPQQ